MAAPSDISIENLTGTWMLVGGTNHILVTYNVSLDHGFTDVYGSSRTKNSRPTRIRCLHWYFSQQNIFLRLLTLSIARNKLGRAEGHWYDRSYR
jgi:hypothetical protein